MKILADFHHADLFRSLELLFEDRLGYELYRPIGIDWHSEGIWKYFDHPDTVRQFLGLQQVDPGDGLRPDGSPILNQAEDESNGVYRLIDGHRPYRRHRGITLAAAKEMPFDLVLTSVYNHVESWQAAMAQYWPQAKHIHQEGNNGPAHPLVKNLLDSTRFPKPTVPNICYYHQEFSLEEFQPTRVVNHRVVTNLMHMQYQHFLQDWTDIRAELPDWLFWNYGADNSDGIARWAHEAIADTAWLWHCKRSGDGYGFNIHHAFACHRPLIVHGHQHIGQTAAALFTHGETVIDLDQVSVPKAAEMLRNADYPAWQGRVGRRFYEVVDFARDAENIKAFLGRLL